MNGHANPTPPAPGAPEPVEATRSERIAAALAVAPLLPAAAGLMLGIVLDRESPAPPAAYVALFVIGGAILPAVRRRAIACALAMVVPACGVGGLLHNASYRRIAADHVVRCTGAEPIGAGLVGIIVSEPFTSQPDFGVFKDMAHRPTSTHFLLDAEELNGTRGPLAVRGTVRVGVAEPVTHVRAGDRVRVFGRMYRPVPPSNPGEPDWPLYQRRRGVLVGLACEHAANVERLGVPGAEAGRLIRLRRHCRRLLLDDVAAVDPAGRSVLEAIILGQRSTVDRAINDAFVATGTVHILSVSGAHLGMLAAAVWALSALLGRSRRQSAGFVLAAVLLYALLAEPSAPVWRSAIMATFLCVGLMLRRPPRTINWLAASALLVLAVRPADLFDPGFQLSYVTLAGLLYLSGPVRELWRGLLFRRDTVLEALRPREPDPPVRTRLTRAAGRCAEGALAACVAAWLAGAPLSLYHFGQISSWGWLNSLLISPIVFLLVTTGFVKLVAAAVWPATGIVLGPLFARITLLLDGWVRLLADVPGVSLMTPSPPLWLVVCVLGVFGLWAARRTIALPGRWIALGLAACAVAGCFWYLPGRPDDGELHVRIASVGDGTAVLIRFPSGRAIVYDVGTTPPYDLYRSTLRPLFGEERVRRLDAAILSHPDLDHFSGLPGLASRVPVRAVWAPPSIADASAADRGKPAVRLLRDELRRLDIPVRRLCAGDRLRAGAGVEATVLWPPSDEKPDPRDSNESSIVLRLRYAGRSILLCGDIERRPQEWLTQHADLRADVLVLPHHGSVKPWTAAFVKAVSPTYVIRSSGKRSEISSPRLNELVRSYAYFNTADVGGILVRIGPRGCAVTAYRSRAPHAVRPHG